MSRLSAPKPIIVGVSGASGSILARATVEALLLRDVPTIVVCTNAARLVWQEELDTPFGETLSECYYPMGDMRASIASGTFATRGMVIVPCSMNSVAAIAHGLAGNLLLRAADVCLKERRKLILVPRETPLHATHFGEHAFTHARRGGDNAPGTGLLSETAGHRRYRPVRGPEGTCCAGH
ncbi:Flavin prenyltransferase UbiX [Geodia barretti]|uniref:Flavin prenyltransferase UbiX n=1 Tax=Geodia barretti TaxID=519541 RepID=A0AA35S0Q4_GEOBA|nr:Flavin prenyltransferase UbiX [Geodia barretti]